MLHTRVTHKPFCEKLLWGNDRLDVTVERELWNHLDQYIYFERRQSLMRDNMHLFKIQAYSGYLNIGQINQWVNKVRVRTQGSCCSVHWNFQRTYLILSKDCVIWSLDLLNGVISCVALGRHFSWESG